MAIQVIAEGGEAVKAGHATLCACPPLTDHRPLVGDATPTREDAPLKPLFLLKTLWILALMLLGGLIHAWVLDFGRFEPSRMDWPKENGAYQVLALAIEEGRVPYHCSIRLQGTQRFLAVPEVVWFPTVLSLTTLTFVQFALLHVLVLYVIGQVGLALLARKLSLDWFSFSAVILIYNLNGHIIGHLSGGHLMWTGYFLFSWLFLGVFCLLDAKDRSLPAVGIAVVLFLMLLQGAFHLWTVSLLFLGILFVSRRELWPVALVVFPLTFLLCAGRLLPAAVTFGGTHNAFLAGFPTLLHLLEALVVPKNLSTPPYVLQTPRLDIDFPVYWAEFSHYIGALLLGFVVFYGLWRRYAPGGGRVRVYTQLDLPMAVVALFSIGWFYWPVTLTPLPMLNAQRLPCRFFVIPLLFVSILAAREYTRCHGGKKLPVGIIALQVALLLVAASDLARHAGGWRVVLADDLFPPKWYYEEYNAAEIIEWDEPRYVLATHAGFLISGAAIVLTGLLAALHETRRRLFGVLERVIGGGREST